MNETKPNLHHKDSSPDFSFRESPEARETSDRSADGWMRRALTAMWRDFPNSHGYGTIPEGV